MKTDFITSDMIAPYIIIGGFGGFRLKGPVQQFATAWADSGSDKTSNAEVWIAHHIPLHSSFTIWQVLYWMSDTATLEVSGAVEKVGQDILRNVIESEEDVLGE